MQRQRPGAACSFDTETCSETATTPGCGSGRRLPCSAMLSISWPSTGWFSDRFVSLHGRRRDLDRVRSLPLVWPDRRRLRGSAGPAICHDYRRRRPRGDRGNRSRSLFRFRAVTSRRSRCRMRPGERAVLFLSRLKGFRRRHIGRRVRPADRIRAASGLVSGRLCRRSGIWRSDDQPVLRAGDVLRARRQLCHFGFVACADQEPFHVVAGRG